MKYEIGGVELNDSFWDCECENDYIHSKTEKQCPKCNAIADDQPDSRQCEIKS